MVEKWTRNNKFKIFKQNDITFWNVVNYHHKTKFKLFTKLFLQLKCWKMFL